LFLSEQSCAIATGRFQGRVHKGLEECTSTVVVFSDPLSPIRSPSSAVKTPENTQDDPGNPESADKGDIQMDHFSDKSYSPGIGSVTNHLV
jgi:hypothetical protein